jgi:hypothetical protein
MTVLTPAEMVTAARGESDREGCVGKPLNQEKDERRGGPPACNHLGEIDAVVEKQVRVEALCVLVDQSCEAEASPAWVLSP